MIRDDINKILQDTGLSDKYKCKKVFVNGSIDRRLDAESNVIHNQNNIPVFDCGWTNWKNRTNEFVLSQKN